MSCHAETFDKSLEDYLQKVKEILEGNQDVKFSVDESEEHDVKFFVDDGEFKCIRNHWSLLNVPISLNLEVECLTQFMISMHNVYSEKENNEVNLKKDYEKLKKKVSTLEEKYHEMVCAKEEFEKEMYKRFILLLNTKKQRIKDLKKLNEDLHDNLMNLENELKHKKRIKSVFETMTDSESDTDSKDFLSNQLSVKKRRLSENHNKNVKKSPNQTLNNKIRKATASTSKVYPKMNEEEEEECELDLRLEEEKHEKSAMNENESEEMVF